MPNNISETRIELSTLNFDTFLILSPLSLLYIYFIINLFIYKNNYLNIF